MKPPIYVRPPLDDERDRLEAGLRSKDLVLRRCQVVLASARGEWVPAIALTLGCNEQTVRNIIHAFNATGRNCSDSRGKQKVVDLVQGIEATSAPGGEERVASSGIA